MNRAELLAAGWKIERVEDRLFEPYYRLTSADGRIQVVTKNDLAYEFLTAYDAMPEGDGSEATHVACTFPCPICDPGIVAGTPPSGSAEGRESGEPTPAERAAVDRAMSALDSMAETWAASINLRTMLASMDKHPDRLDRFFNLVTQGWVEGAYAGRTSLQHSPPLADDTTVRVPRELTAENGAKAALMGEFTMDVTRNCTEYDCDHGVDYDCPVCGGSGQITDRQPVDWTTIKEIWKAGIAHFAAAQTEGGGR